MYQLIVGLVSLLIPAVCVYWLSKSDGKAVPEKPVILGAFHRKGLIPLQNPCRTCGCSSLEGSRAMVTVRATFPENTGHYAVRERNCPECGEYSLKAVKA